MVNWIDIVVPIAVSLIIVAVSIYLFTIYCHPEEKGFGNSVASKILVIVSLVLAWSQVLILPLDLGVGGAQSGSTFDLLYFILYPIIFVFVAFLNPLAMFFYESDPTDSTGKRFFWSFLFAFIVTAVWCVLTFVSYVWLGVYDVNGVSERINAALYILLALSLVGWVFMAVNGAVGLVYLPYQLILYFINRPSPLTTQQGHKKKAQLQTLSSELISQGQKVKSKSQELQNFQGGWFSKKRAQSQFNTILQKYKSSVDKLQKDYEYFNNNLTRQQRHPIVYIIALIFGIISILVSILWIFQILGHIINPNGLPLYGFMDNWFFNLAQGGGSFFGTLLYSIFVIYLMICMVRGNIVFGFRIPFLLKVHVMVINRTYMNAMLFNCNLMLLASTAISFIGLWAFPQYFSTGECYLALIYSTQIINLPMFGGLYGQYIPMIAMQVTILVVILVTLAKGLWSLKKDKGKKEDKKVQMLKQKL